MTPISDCFHPHDFRVDYIRTHISGKESDAVIRLHEKAYAIPLRFLTLALKPYHVIINAPRKVVDTRDLAHKMADYAEGRPVLFTTEPSYPPMSLKGLSDHLKALCPVKEKHG